MFLRSKLFLFFLMVGLVFSSCSKEDFSDQIISSPSDVEMNASYESVIETMAQGLSKTIESENWLSNISERSMRKENGDQVFVYALAKDITLNNKSLSQNIFQTADLPAEEMDNYILNNHPLLSIALNGQEVKKTTKVFYDHRGDDNYLPTEEVYYFVNGEKHSMAYADVDKENDTYFIIRKNERVATVDNSTGKIKEAVENDLKRVEGLNDYFYSSEALLGTAGNLSYRLTYEIDESEIITIDQNTEKVANCYRDGNTRREGVLYYRTTNDHDGGFNGSGEFEVTFTLTNANAEEFSYYVRKTNIQDDNQIRTFGWNAFHWDKNYHGDRYEVALWEDDNSSDDGRYSGSFTANIPGIGNIGLSYDFGANSDDFIGTAEIDYCGFNIGWLGLGDAQLYCGAVY